MGQLEDTILPYAEQKAAKNNIFKDVCVGEWSHVSSHGDTSLSISFVLPCLENSGTTFPPFPPRNVHLFVFQPTV